MTEIKLKVTDQHLRAVVYPLIASGGINENRITVEFEGTEWTGYVCGVAFNTDEDPDTIYTQNLDSNNQCIVPWEVTEKAGTLFVAVFGTATTDVKRTTEVTAIEIVNGAGNGNAIPAPPTPTVYDQLVALINTKQDLLVSGTNIKTVNSQSLLGSGNIDISSAGIFRCTTVNTFSEIYAAFYTNGLLPVFDDGTGRKYYPVDMAQSSPTAFEFVSTVEDSTGIDIAVAFVNSTDVWNVYDHGHLQDLLISGTNIKTINNTSLLGSGDISISGASNLYICTFDTTTYAEITQALNDGKLPYCIYDDFLYIYSNSDGTYHNFKVCRTTNNISYIRVNASNIWSFGGSTLQPVSGRVTSISSSSTDAQYPSAKCVYDVITAISSSGLAEFKVTLTTANFSTGAYTETVAGLSAYSKYFVMPDPDYNFGKYYASDMRFSINGNTFNAFTGSYQSVDLHIVIYAYN